MGLKFANFAKSLIANVGGIGSGDVALTVSAGEGAFFPALATGDYFYCTLVSVAGVREIIKVTARSIDTFTISRAQDGTSASAFAEGDIVSLRLNKAALDEFAIDSELVSVAADLTTHLASDYHFPAGTIMVFGQSSAPTGWTKKTDWVNASMLVYVTGNISSGGSANPVSAHTHTGPSHTHTGPYHLHATSAATAPLPVHTHTLSSFGTYPSPGGIGAIVRTVAAGTITTDSAGTGGTHTHGNTGYEGNGATSAGGTGATGGNSAPLYQTVIAATKDAY